MSIADDLRTTARRTYGVDLVDAEMMFEAADRLDELEAALRWYNDNDTVPGQTDGMGCGCCSHRVDVPETVQAAWDSVPS